MQQNIIVWDAIKREYPNGYTGARTWKAHNAPKEPKMFELWELVIGSAIIVLTAWAVRLYFKGML